MSRFAIWGQFNWGQANWTEWTPYGVSKSGSSSAGDFDVVRTNRSIEKQSFADKDSSLLQSLLGHQWRFNSIGILSLFTSFSGVGHDTSRSDGLLGKFAPFCGIATNASFADGNMSFWAMMTGASDNHEAALSALLYYLAAFVGAAENESFALGDLTRMWEKEGPLPGKWDSKGGPDSIWTPIPMVATNWRER